MPLVPLQKLPDASRTWVFSADRTLSEKQSQELMPEVDRFLASWNAHGAPLTVGREFKYGRFLTVAVDQSTAGASGCSIDGLFRTLKSLEPKVGASLVTSGLIFFSDKNGVIQSVDRETFTQLGADGKVSSDTKVFDPTVTTLREWRARFELPLRDSWHAKLIGQNQPA
ncbi:MAG TPA: hypothetical protein VJ865_01125 [Gemmatimonadaceae bacterium]|nr:hypothetical protein [Gemmatimonadaceae bacterium]